MTITISKKHIAIGLVLVLTLVLVQGAGASDGESIYACKNPEGIIRVVEDTASCRPQETLLQWNVEGPQGVQGPQGEQGPEGQPGVSAPDYWTSSVRLYVEEGQVAAGAWLDRPECPEGTEVLVHGIEAAPDISWSPDVVHHLPRWGVYVNTAQLSDGSGSSRPLAVMGEGPEHLSTFLPGGQLMWDNVAVILLGGATASHTFGFNIHVTGSCGTPSVNIEN